MLQKWGHVSFNNSAAVGGPFGAVSIGLVALASEAMEAGEVLICRVVAKLCCKHFYVATGVASSKACGA